jgi:hypothetical protein
VTTCDVFPTSRPDHNRDRVLEIHQEMRILSLIYILKPTFVFASPFLQHLYNTDQSIPSEPDVEPGSPDFWFHIIVSAVLVLIGGVFSG